MSQTPGFARKALALGAFVLACLAVFGWFLSLSGTTVVPRATYGLKVAVPSAIALAQHADVRHAGVKIGTVDDVSLDGAHAVLAVSLDRRYAPVYRDARVLVRGKTMQGENYVDIDPGSPPAGAVPDGGSLALSQAPESTQIDQLFASFDARRRRDLKRILNALGGGLDGNGRQLNGFLDGTGRTTSAARPIVATLAREHQRVAGLVDDFGRVTRAIGDRGTDVRLLAHRGRRLAEAVAQRDHRLRQTLAALPGFLHQAGSTTARLGRYSVSTTPVMRDLRLATLQLVPAMSQLRPAAEATRTTMRSLGAFTHQAAPLTRRLRRFSAVSAHLTGPLGAALRQLNPLVAYAVPFAKELGAAAASNRAGTAYYDAVGHYVRLGPVLISPSALAGTLTPGQNAALTALTKTGVLAKLNVDTRGSDAYPKAGSLNDAPTSFSGTYPRLEPDPPYVTGGGR
jgi:phospholipid/cholesterol/gamma-HCH transport system substrate-binding protein